MGSARLFLVVRRCGIVEGYDSFGGCLVVEAKTRIEEENWDWVKFLCGTKQERNRNAVDYTMLLSRIFSVLQMEIVLVEIIQKKFREYLENIWKIYYAR